jgi:hypothetical protein
LEALKEPSSPRAKELCTAASERKKLN